MTDKSWPFDQPPNCAVLTLRPIVFEGHPILYVSHDDHDDGWQFMGGDHPKAEMAAIVALKEIVDLDSSVLEIADLP
jgi:hypothetical protein